MVIKEKGSAWSEKGTSIKVSEIGSRSFQSNRREKIFEWGKWNYLLFLLFVNVIYSFVWKRFVLFDPDTGSRSVGICSPILHFEYSAPRVEGNEKATLKLLATVSESCVQIMQRNEPLGCNRKNLRKLWCASLVCEQLRLSPGHNRNNYKIQMLKTQRMRLFELGWNSWFWNETNRLRWEPERKMIISLHDRGRLDLHYILQ